MNLGTTVGRLFLLGALALMLAGSSCPNVNITIPPSGDSTDGTDGTTDTGNGDEPVALLAIETYATNTGGANGMAVRPSDGALFIASPSGIFGPISEGDDVSTMEAFGATNLADASLFDNVQPTQVLAITDSGEFWIGSDCCNTMAVVPAEGGDAEPFLGLLGTTEDIKPETLAIVPTGFDGPQVDPGNLLAGQDTTFSLLAAIDVAGDDTVTYVDNDSSTNREAHHLAFGPDGVLYSSRALLGLTFSGIQTIDTDGSPTALPGTLGVSAHSFVVRDNGDLIIRGSMDTTTTDVFSGLLIWSATDQTTTSALTLPAEESSEDDELVMTSDGTILLSLPERNEIVRVSDVP